MKSLYYILLSMRPRQWTKNLLVLAPLFFSSSFSDKTLSARSFEGFLIFCVLAGSVYIFNDLLDIKDDRKHPTKKLRPIAAGKLHTAVAWAAAIILPVLGLLWAFKVNKLFGYTALVYMIIQIFYSLWMKNRAILDIFVIALGFVIRVVAGARIINVPMSPWLLVCTMFLSLFLAVGKRRYELVSVEAKAHRESLKGYSTALLDHMMTIVTSCTVMAYALYTLAPETVAKLHTHNLIYTLPFVILGIFRYLYLIYNEGKGGSPEDILLSDIPLIIDIVLYGVMVWLILYKYL